MFARASSFSALVGMAVDVVGLFMALLSFVKSAPRAYRLKASNAAPPISRSIGTIPIPGLEGQTSRAVAHNDRMYSHARLGYVGNFEPDSDGARPMNDSKQEAVPPSAQYYREKAEELRRVYRASVRHRRRLLMSPVPPYQEQHRCLRAVSGWSKAPDGIVPAPANSGG